MTILCLSNNISIKIMKITLKKFFDKNTCFGTKNVVYNYLRVYFYSYYWAGEFRFGFGWRTSE